MIDSKLLFGKDMKLSASASFPNTIDAGVSETSYGVNRHGAGYFNVHISEDVTGTSCVVKLQDCATTDGTYADVANGAITVTGAVAGDVLSIAMPKTRQFVKATIVATAITKGLATAFIGPSEASH